jgi:predicted porin
MKKLTTTLLLTAAGLAPASQASELNINGFLSVGASMLDEQKASIAGADNNGGFKQDTILGLQIQKQVNESTTATGQLVSRGSDDYSTEAAWAFVTYAATDDLDIRMGRLRIPFFYYSDFLEVSYAYNWVRPPGEVYRIPFSSIDGTDLNYRYSSGNLDGSVQVYYGRYQGPFIQDFGQGPETYAADFKNFTGIVLNNNYGNFGSRLSYHQAELNIASPAGSTLGAIAVAGSDFAFTGQASTFLEAALSYDDGDNSLIAEWTSLEHDNAAFLDDQAWMFSAAKRFSDITAHVTYTQHKTEFDSGIQGAIQKTLPLETDQTSTIIGVRYDYDSSTALKLEVQSNDEKTTDGAKGDSATLYSVAINIVF